DMRLSEPARGRRHMSCRLNLLCCGAIDKKFRTGIRNPMAGPDPIRADVLIAGGGFAGLALAVALRQALGRRFAVTVADPVLAATPSRDPRASAIAAAARRLFETIGVWDAVAGEAQPMLDMVVTDSRLDDA